MAALGVDIWPLECMCFMALVSRMTTCSPPQRVCILLELELSCSCRIPCVFCSGLPLGPVISWLSKKAHLAQPVVITWLPASGRFYRSLASLPEGGRGKAIKAETQTSAFCYLVTVLVNDGTRGEGNWSCRVSIAIWTTSQKLCWASVFGNRKWFQTWTWSLSPEKMG